MIIDTVPSNNSFQPEERLPTPERNAGDPGISRLAFGTLNRNNPVLLDIIGIYILNALQYQYSCRYILNGIHNNNYYLYSNFNLILNLYRI